MKEYLIPDMYWAKTDNGVYVSHESVCVLNTGKITAAISMTLYFEDRAPVEGISFECGPERTIHFRMDKVLVNGVHIPRGVPYAAKLVSDVPVAIQYTRVDTTQSENALMTTIIQ